MTTYFYRDCFPSNKHFFIFQPFEDGLIFIPKNILIDKISTYYHFQTGWAYGGQDDHYIHPDRGNFIK